MRVTSRGTTSCSNDTVTAPVGVARAVLDNPTDADDVVSEAFAAVLAALQRGKGPREEFAGYLVSAVRHEAYRTNRRRGRVHPVAEHGDEALDATVTPEDADILRTAFESLPTVDRHVLWRTEIEGLSHADIARDDGSTVQAIATRASRARHALRGAYLAEHVGLVFTEPPTGPDCADTRRQLAELVRGRVSAADNDASKDTSPSARRAARVVTIWNG